MLLGMSCVICDMKSRYVGEECAVNRLQDTVGRILMALNGELGSNKEGGVVRVDIGVYWFYVVILPKPR